MRNLGNGQALAYEKKGISHASQFHLFSLLASLSPKLNIKNCFYPEVSIVLTSHQISILLHQMENVTESHSWTKFRKQLTHLQPQNTKEDRIIQNLKATDQDRMFSVR